MYQGKKWSSREKRLVHKWEEEGVKLMMAEILTSCVKSFLGEKWEENLDSCKIIMTFKNRYRQIGQGKI